ncbi:MAG TPA: DUF2273 domain-containing protein [Bacillota bacterium]|nr:DUF2273 domain-containing protein [Bacillota bacterium]HPT87375.1 DUF2273 domain-containing protein [Bacillota bacterium]
MGEILKDLLPKLSAYKGRILGGIIGFIAGLIWAYKSFGAALAFVISIVLGYYVGKRFDKQDSLKDILERVLPPKK